MSGKIISEMFPQAKKRKLKDCEIASILTDLPEDVQMCFAQFLSFTDVINCMRLVCKSWRRFPLTHFESSYPNEWVRENLLGEVDTLVGMNTNFSTFSLSEIRGAMKKAKNLQELRFTACPWKSLSFLKPCKDSLLTLEITRPKKLSDFEILSQCKNLEAVYFTSATGKDVARVINCLPSSIKALSILDGAKCVISSESWLQISRLTLLESLSISSCSMAKGSDTFLEISSLQSLRALKLNRIDNLTALHGISTLKHLKDVNINGCRALSTISSFPPEVRKLQLTNCKELLNLPHISQLASVETITTTSLALIRKMESDAYEPRLRELFCSRIKSEGITINVRKFRQLEEIVFDSCGIKELHGLEHLKSLKSISLLFCRELLSLDISTLAQLNTLRLHSCTFLRKIDGFKDCTGLEIFECIQCTFLRRLPNISRLPNLRQLSLRGCRSLVGSPSIEKINQLDLFVPP